MKISGERILLFGDSLSHHGSDYDVEIWDVDQGSDRLSNAPGDLLASMLMEQGAEAVRIDANVGRSAINFWQGGARWQRSSSDDLIASDQQFAPTKVIVFLGTNDLGMDTTSDASGFQLIKNSFPNADFIVIGPPIFADPNRNMQAEVVYGTLRDVFGSANVIDARPLSTTDGRASDGIHFGGQAAVYFANNLLGAVQSAGGLALWQWVALGAAGVGLLIGAGIFVQHRETRRASLQGAAEDESMAEQSLKEEEQAIEDYGEREEAAEDPDLANIFHHNRGEEEQHAEALRTWQHDHQLEAAREPKKLPVPFPFERKPMVPSRWHDDYHKERVSLSSLIATQNYVTAKGTRGYKAHEPRHDIDLPLVYRTSDGRAYIADGHHRLVAAYKRGDHDALVRVVDIGDPDHPTRAQLDGPEEDAAIRARYEAKPDLAEIRSRKPRPLLKLYRHPTPEQEAEWKARMSAWNSEYRKASKEYKAAVEAMNSLYYREHA